MCTTRNVKPGAKRRAKREVAVCVALAKHGAPLFPGECAGRFLMGPVEEGGALKWLVGCSVFWSNSKAVRGGDIREVEDLEGETNCVDSTEGNACEIFGGFFHNREIMMALRRNVERLTD